MSLLNGTAPMDPDTVRVIQGLQETDSPAPLIKEFSMSPDHTRFLAAITLALLAACDKSSETASAPPPVVAVPAPVAQASPPAACGEDAEREIFAEALRGLAAADRGDFQSYLAASQNLKSRPAECRPVLERLQPVALRCSEPEAKALMQGTTLLTEAGAAGNVQEFLAIYDRIEQAVTPACWQAMHQHSHPVVVSACSTEDLDRLAAHAPEVLRATTIAAVSMDTGRMLQVQATMLSLMQSLPPPCLEAIKAASRTQPEAPSASGGMPGVYDHGAGAYSVPGVAYCGASGCIPL